MPQADTQTKAENLAANLARGSLRPHIVVRVFAHYFAVPRPAMSDLAYAELKLFLTRIGCSVESEFDTTGARVPTV